MQKFPTRFADKIIRVLSGFDRLVFRDYLLRLSYTAGLEGQDLRLRANVSQAVNKRALDDLAVLADPTSLQDLLQSVAQPTELRGRRVRALQPFAAPDVDLLTGIAHGEFLLQGFRNRDLVPLLFPTPAPDPLPSRRRSAAVSRRLRLLRAHHLIESVPGSYRYLLTPHGRTLTAAVLAARELPLSALRPAGSSTSHRSSERGASPPESAPAAGAAPHGAPPRRSARSGFLPRGACAPAHGRGPVPASP